MAILGGIAFYLAGRDGGRAAMLPMAAMAVATLVSYERARAESLGYNAKGGLMERAERTIALMIGLAFPVLLIPVLWLLVGLTSFTAVHRFVMVWRQAAKPPRVRRAGVVPAPRALIASRGRRGPSVGGRGVNSWPLRAVCAPAQSRRERVRRRPTNRP